MIINDLADDLGIELLPEVDERVQEVSESPLIDTLNTLIDELRADKERLIEEKDQIALDKRLQDTRHYEEKQSFHSLIREEKHARTLLEQELQELKFISVSKVDDELEEVKDNLTEEVQEVEETKRSLFSRIFKK